MFNKNNNTLNGVITAFIAFLLFIISLIGLFSPLEYEASAGISDFYSSLYVYPFLIYLVASGIYVYNNSKDLYLRYSALILTTGIILTSIIDITDAIFFDYRFIDMHLSYYSIYYYFSMICVLIISIASLYTLKFLFKDIKKIPLKKIFVFSSILIGAAILLMIGASMSYEEESNTILFSIFSFSSALFVTYGIIILIGTTIVHLYRKFNNEAIKKINRK